MDQKPNYYAVVPADVRYDKDLIPHARLLYAEISALANKDGYCWATNAHFAELYGVSERAIQNWLSKLSKKGYVNLKMIPKDDGSFERRVYIATPMKKSSPHHEEKFTPPLKKSSPSPIIVNNKRVIKGDHLNILENFSYPEKLSEEQKADRINKIYQELMASHSWHADAARVGMCSKGEVMLQLKIFLNELKAKETYFRPLADIKQHFISWLKKIKQPI